MLWAHQVIVLLPQPGFPLAVPRVLSEEVWATSPQVAKSTSADRFAALNNGMSRSVSSAGIGRDGAVPLSRSSSQGGIGMLPHGDYSTQRTHSSCGGRRSDKPSSGPSSTSHFSSPSHLLSTARIAEYRKSWVADPPSGPNNLLVVGRKVLH